MATLKAWLTACLRIKFQDKLSNVASQSNSRSAEQKSSEVQAVHVLSCLPRASLRACSGMVTGGCFEQWSASRPRSSLWAGCR